MRSKKLYFQSLKKLSSELLHFPQLVIVLILIQYPIFSQPSFIRLNQLGYHQLDNKIAVIGSEKNIEQYSFNIFSVNDENNPIYTGILSNNRGGKNSPFKYNYECDFSDFKSKGTFYIKLEDNSKSPMFSIGSINQYQQAVKTLLDFFHAQRCGDIDPILHEPCHLNDMNAEIDVSGGWHDAGDYIKYMITVSSATVEMLTAADYFNSFERSNTDSTPTDELIQAVLEEAKIGLEWMLKMTSQYEKGIYYYQVSGEEDHSGWRMPEDDDKERDKNKSRSLHQGWGGNILGRSVASFSIAARVFKEIDPIFAQNCLDRALALFKGRKNYEYAQPSIPVHFYNERNWIEDMVLASAELYLTTGEEEYLKYCDENIPQLKNDDIGWNSSDFLAFAASYRADIKKSYCKDKMVNALNEIIDISKKDPFYLSSGYAWGTTALFTANAQKAIMYYYLTSDNSFLKMADDQRDYLLGRNPWGISFVIGLGDKYPKNAHSQLNSLSGLHRGGIVGGPAEKNHWLRTFPDLKIENDDYKEFQSDIIYYDERQDYYCNEVALDYTVPSVFIFLFNSYKYLRN